LLEQGTTTKSQITLGVANDTRDNPFSAARAIALPSLRTWPADSLAAMSRSSVSRLKAGNISPLQGSILVLSAQAASVGTPGATGTFVHIYDRLFRRFKRFARFDYRDVSPRDITGEPLGGQSLAAFTIEYTMPIIEKARFAVFFDSGFVNRVRGISTRRTTWRVGIGLRLDLPSVHANRLRHTLEKGPYKMPRAGS